MCVMAFLATLPIYLVLSFAIVAFEESGHYVEVGAITAVAVLVLVYGLVLPGLGRQRLAERWAAGQEVDRARALEATYAWARGAVARAVVGNAVWAALLSVIVGVIAGATGPRLVQYAILGAVVGIACQLIAVHSFAEAPMRPVRIALAGDTGIGDALPRSRPNFAPWSNCPYSRSRWCSPSRARYWPPCSIRPVRSPCSGW
jgi:hypothetical protein